MYPGVPAVKRILDLVASVVGLVALAPLLILVAVAIRISDGGPALFRQTRVGLAGRTFNMWKFRSMTVDAEAKCILLAAANERHGPLFKIDHDPRVTRLGGFLRRSSIDELPQLWNVLCGKMSLVGPRPALPIEVAFFPTELLARHHVMPGITGLWQVKSRDDPSFEAYVHHDLHYVANWSIALDLLIIVGTVRQLTRRTKSPNLLTSEPERRIILS